MVPTGVDGERTGERTGGLLEPVGATAPPPSTSHVGGAGGFFGGLFRGVVQFVVFFSFYVLLSGQVHNSFLMTVGAVGCALVVALGAHLRILDGEGMPIGKWLRTGLYLPWLLWQVVIANWEVFRLVWRRKIVITPRMVVIEHGLESPYAIATLANSITLTPGTVTAHIGPRTVHVHALTEEAARELESGAMLRRVQRIDGRRPSGVTEPGREESVVDGHR